MDVVLLVRSERTLAAREGAGVQGIQRPRVSRLQLHQARLPRKRLIVQMRTFTLFVLPQRGESLSAGLHRRSFAEITHTCAAVRRKIRLHWP